MTPGPEPHATADSRTVGKSGSVIQAAAALPIGSVPERGVAHFKLDLEGGFFLNANRVSLGEIKNECARLIQIGGLAIYYRVDAGGELAPDGLGMIRTICEAGLPLTFSLRDYDPKVLVADYFLPPPHMP